MVKSRLMMEVGLTSLKDLHICRQVCRAWNDEIVNNIWGNASNRNKLENKLEECWRTGTPKYEKTERIFDRKVNIAAATENCLVLIECSNKSSLWILRNEEEWNLTVEGTVCLCVVTKEMLVLVLHNCPCFHNHKDHKMEVYDLLSRSKVMERTQNVDDRNLAGCDGCRVLMAREELEIINIRDSSSSFEVSMRESDLRPGRILNFQYPLILVHARDTETIMIWKIDDTSKSIFIASEYNSIDDVDELLCAAIVDTKVVLLKLRSLTLNNFNGDDVQRVQWYTYPMGWYHNYRKFAIIFGFGSEIDSESETEGEGYQEPKTKKPTVFIYHVEDEHLVPREFEFDDELKDEREEREWIVMNRTYIKRYTVHDNSLQIEKLKFVE